MAGGRVVSVNVGKPGPVQMGSRTKTTGIFKEPQAGRVPVAGVTVGDDVQVDRRYHGGPTQAVYAYAAEDYAWWEAELGAELAPGTFGENLTTRGMDVTNALIGEVWAINDVALQVTNPRMPCSTLRARMGIPGFVKRFAASGRFGAYFAIVKEGHIGAGDGIEIVHRPGHAVSIARLGAAYVDRDLAQAEAIFVELGRPEGRAAWIESLRAKAG